MIHQNFQSLGMPCQWLWIPEERLCPGVPEGSGRGLEAGEESIAAPAKQINGCLTERETAAESGAEQGTPGE
jgi:hypothetical protein